MILNDSKSARLKVLDKVPSGIYNINLNGQNIKLKVIEGKDSFYYNKNEYNIIKKVYAILDNGDILFNICYRNCYSRIDNGGCFEVDFEPNFSTKTSNKEICCVEYSNWAGDSAQYSVNGVEYKLYGLNHEFYEPCLKEKNDANQIKYNISPKKGIIYKKMDNIQIRIGLEDNSFKIYESKEPHNEITDEKILQSINKIETLEEIKEKIKIFEYGSTIVNEYPIMEILDKLIEKFEFILMEKEIEKNKYKIKNNFTFFKRKK